VPLVRVVSATIRRVTSTVRSREGAARPIGDGHEVGGERLDTTDGPPQRLTVLGGKNSNENVGDVPVNGCLPTCPR
jgi:hypothetical protein